MVQPLERKGDWSISSESLITTYRCHDSAHAQCQFYHQRGLYTSPLSFIRHSLRGQISLNWPLYQDCTPALECKRNHNGLWLHVAQSTYCTISHWTSLPVRAARTRHKWHFWLLTVVMILLRAPTTACIRGSELISVQRTMSTMSSSRMTTIRCVSIYKFERVTYVASFRIMGHSNVRKAEDSLKKLNQPKGEKWSSYSDHVPLRLYSPPFGLYFHDQ